MATDDESLATKTENWIVTTLRATATFADRDVEPYKGTHEPQSADLVAELTAHSNPYVVTWFQRDTREGLEEGSRDRRAVYRILVVGQNQRPGAARRGDGTTPGTNKYRDVLSAALDTKDNIAAGPAVSAGGFYAQYAEIQTNDVVWPQADAFIMEVILMVHEMPTP
jgi:hypothetical protein